MMYCYIVNNYKEVGFFKSNIDMKDGGTVFAGLQTFEIIGYSSDEIKIGGLAIDLGIVDDASDFFSAQKWAEDGWRVVTPVEVSKEEDVKELYQKFQSTPVMEYVGGVDDPMVINVTDDDEDLAF